MGKNFWMIVETLENYEVAREIGFSEYAFGAKYRRRAERMQPNDRFLFYVKDLRKWVATATVTSPCFENDRGIWKPNGSMMNRRYSVGLTPDIVLKENDFIDALVLGPRLEYVKRWAPEDWPLAFFDVLHLLPQRDFRLIEGEMRRLLPRRRNRGNRSGGRPADRRPSQGPGRFDGESQGGRPRRNSANRPADRD